MPGPARRRGGLQRAGRRVAVRPAAHRGPGRARPGPARRGRRGARGPGGRGGPVLGRRPGRGGRIPARRGASARAARHVQRRADPADLQDRRPGQRRGRRPGKDPAAARVRRERHVRAVGIRELRRRGADRALRRARGRRQRPAAGVADDDLPHRRPGHADRRASAAAAHGRRGGRRAPVRVRRQPAVLDLRLRAAPERRRARTRPRASRPPSRRSRSCSRTR